jgi:hypothetical protein
VFGHDWFIARLLVLVKPIMMTHAFQLAPDAKESGRRVNIMNIDSKEIVIEVEVNSLVDDNSISFKISKEIILPRI